MNNTIPWNHINNKIPKKDKLLIYYADCLNQPAHTGYYHGEETSEDFGNLGHTFGGLQGFLTGDVTHWCYINTPTK
jgi:hypothetical protein